LRQGGRPLRTLEDCRIGGYVGQNLHLLDSGMTKADPNKQSRSKRTGIHPPGQARFRAVMKAAEELGLLGGKDTRIGGRMSAQLIAQAKQRTGIEADTDLIEFALANIALKDDFAKTFRETRGTVDPTLKLGF